ncbi:MAG TPA: GMC family oxidoreductase [Anaerolineae bacterium]|jgi:choline dehydrogenase-like flavoprotein
MANDKTVVIIGSGFGGSMTGLSLARAFKARKKGETILMLERGTWWTTPVGTVQDKELKTADFLKDKKQPFQFWNSVDHFKGIFDLVTRCWRRPGNEDGLYDITTFGRDQLFDKQDDGVTVLRASGVGGGSLVYANVTIRPPDFVLDAWPATWDKPTRDHYYNLARDAIGFGVLWARAMEQKNHIPYIGANILAGDAGKGIEPHLQPNLPVVPKDDTTGDTIGPVNTGLSNVVTRSARLDPHWQVVDTPANPRGVKRIDVTKLKGPDGKPTGLYDMWLDRARVFQTAMSAITDDYGTVDSSINDLIPEADNPLMNEFEMTGADAQHAEKNYCERQGRCIIGCLPGARHTLNKQLMTAVIGNPKNPGAAAPFDGIMSIQALAEVDYIEQLPAGGYAVHYQLRDADEPGEFVEMKVTADKVIVAAGCIGTNEILLRSKAMGGLPHLSDRLGFGFSTNGDYLAFCETDERLGLTRGPITTSFGHFNNGPADDPSKFHTIEDNGIPKVFSTLTGFGIEVVRAAAGGHSGIPSLLQILTHAAGTFISESLEALSNRDHRAEVFESEEERTNKIMCIAGMGRDGAKGQFTLGDPEEGDTPLRLNRVDGLKFHEDPIYNEIRATLSKFAQKLTTAPGKDFINPLQIGGAMKLGLSHPLGGCSMGVDAATGVADEFGRVFNTAAAGPRPFYEGLYVADAALVPSALGVNPSLTISALALRAVDQWISELP